MRSGIFAVLLGLAFIYISALVFIPADTLSTAIWIEELGLRHAISGTSTLFSAINSYPLSKESVFFSIFVSVANIAFAYLTVFGGGWIIGKNDSTMIDVFKAIWSGNTKGVNMTKLGYFSVLIFITVFETLTGADFRGQDGTLWGWVKAIGFAFIVENAGSDFALTAGSSLLLNGIFQTWRAWKAGRDDINNLRNTLAGRRPPQDRERPGDNRGNQGGNGGNKGGNRHENRDRGHQGRDPQMGNRREIVIPDGLPIHESRIMPVPRYRNEG